jgi:hypothetical protein
MKTFDVSSTQALLILNWVTHDTAANINANKLSCSKDHCIRWTRYQNLDLWFVRWEIFLIHYGFATKVDGALVFEEESMQQIMNMNDTCILLDGSNGTQGGCPTVTFYDVRFSQLGSAMSKSALTTTMISWSSAAGELIPPHFQFQTTAQTAEAKAIRIKCLHYMLNVQAYFGYNKALSLPISFGFNHKGGMDDNDFFECLQLLIIKLYPDAAPVKGMWVAEKCDSGPGWLNPKLLAYL